MGIGFAIIALIVVGGVVGASLNFGGVVLGIPLVFLFIGAILGKETMQRQQRILRMKRFRREAQARRVGFDTKDKRTVV